MTLKPRNELILAVALTNFRVSHRVSAEKCFEFWTLRASFTPPVRAELRKCRAMHRNPVGAGRV